MEKSMQDFKQEKRTNYHSVTMLEILVGLIILLMMIAVIAPVTVHYLNKATARAVLAEAKAAKMAMTSVSLEHYAQDTLFYDQSQPYGFAKGVPEEIKELGRFPGELYLQQYDPSKRVVRMLSYQEDRYVAVYTQAKETGRWNVYRNQHLIKH
ncbi:MAG: hypothetical protein RR275_06740 [Lachnospiraceae bacterium]